MGTCSEAICKRRILFPSIQHLTWLPQGRPQGKQKCGKISDFELTHWLKHRITRKQLKIDRYMLRGVWQALNCLSIHANCVITAGASPGETKMWETVEDRWVHAARGLASTELSFHLCNVLRDCHRGVPRANKKWRPGYVKMAIFTARCYA